MNNDYERYNFWHIELELTQKPKQVEKQELPLPKTEEKSELEIATAEQNT